jgi:hypothetical protein
MMFRKNDKYVHILLLFSSFFLAVFEMQSSKIMKVFDRVQQTCLDHRYANSQKNICDDICKNTA